MKYVYLVLTLGVLGALGLPSDALAQAPKAEAFALPGDATASGRIVQLAAVLTLASVAPALLIMMTSFTRFLIAFSFLRMGLGLQSSPPNLVLISLSLIMTFYVMSPAMDTAWQTGVKPLMENRIGEQEAFGRVVAPFKDFMRANVREKDFKLFETLAVEKIKLKHDAPEVELRILLPAFIVSELRRGFEIGFLVVLPFLVIDLIVSTMVMSMGMMMLSPAVFSLPCKVLYFVLIDGWHLLVGGLVRSFA